MDTEQTIESAIDRFASVGALTAAHLALQGEYARDPQAPEVMGKIQAFLEKGVATGSLLDHPDDRLVCQSLLDYWVTTLYSAGVEEVNGALLAFDPESAPMLPDEPCPYLGLGEFQEQDADKFFGRKHLVEYMVKRLAPRGARLLLVIGPSGAGKSSVVKAGLLPELKGDAVEGSSSWFYHPSIVPGDSPSRNLQRCIDEDKAGGQVQVFVIDQFEELFTLCRDSAEREAFAGKLSALADEGHAIIITLRSDFEPYLYQQLPAFEEKLDDARVAVNSLSALDLRCAIEEPAKEVGLKFEKGVVERLVQDLVGEPAGLPLLQFTLMKLWENRQRNRITMAEYKKLGGARMALALSADAIYNEFIPEECTTAKRLFLRLVQPGEGLEVTRKRVAQEDLYRSGEAKDRVDRVLDKFISARLIRRIEGSDDTPVQFEVIHEALVRNWPKLTEWLDSARNRLRQHVKLTSAAEEWQRQGQKQAFLFRGDQLAEVELSTRGFEEELGPDELAFLKASRKLSEAERRKEERGKYVMIGLIGAGISLVAITILAIIAYFNAEEAKNSLAVAEAAEKDANEKFQLAEEQRDIAKKQTAIAEQQRRIAEEALYLRGKTYLQNARFNQNQSNHFASAMMGSMGLGFRGFGIPEQVKGEADYPVLIRREKDPQLHEELEMLVTNNLRTGFPIWQSPAENHHLAPVTGVACSPDPDRPWLVSCSPDKTIKLWNADTGQALSEAGGNESPLQCVAFGNSNRIASGDAAGAIRIWTLKADENDTIAFIDPVQLLGHTSPVLSLRFVDEATLESRSAEAVKRWDLVELREIDSEVPEPDGTAESAAVRAWSADGQLRADGDPQTGEISITDSASVTRRLEKRHPAGVTSLAFNADASLLVSGGADRKIRLWKLGSGDVEPVHDVSSQGHRAGVSKLVFHPDGRLASLSSDQSIHIWSASDRPEITESVSWEQPVHSFAWGIDAESGEEVRLIGDDQGRLRLWDPSGKRWLEMSDRLSASEPEPEVSAEDGAAAAEGGPPKPISQSVKLLELSADGRYAVSYGDDRRIKLWSVADRSIAAQSPILSEAVFSLKFSAEGMLIISGGEQSVRLWDVRALSDKPLLDLPIRAGNYMPGPIRSIAVSPRGRLFATGSGKFVQLWDLADLGAGATSPTRGASGAPMEHSAEVAALAFRGDGEVLASSAADGSVKLWRIAEESTPLIGAVSAHQTGVHTMAFSPGGDRLAMGGLSDSSLKMWFVGKAPEASPPRDLATYLRDGWCELEGRNVTFRAVANHNLFAVQKFEVDHIPASSPPPAADSLPAELVEADCLRLLRARGQLPIVTARTGMRMIWVETIGGWVGETEVTQAQFALGGGADVSTFDGADRPVENLSWAEAVKFCEEVTISERDNGTLPEGYEYSLPTEAQWLKFVAGANLEQAVHAQPETADVKTKPPNAHGLYDVRGNVWEMTLTPHGSRPGYALRGGCYGSTSAAIIGAGFRENTERDNRYKQYGFRCVLVKKGE